jgi:glycosyltransferase involved in cell wall biosynthesis
MKICFVSFFPPEKEGVADYSYYLIKSIEDICNECRFYVMAGSLDSKQRLARALSSDQNLKVFRIWNMRSIKGMLQSIILIMKTLTALKADILHIQYVFKRPMGGSVGEPFLVLMLATKLIRKVGIVVSLHDFWLPFEAEQRAYEITGSKLAAKLYRLYYEAYMRIMLSVPDLIINIVNVKLSPVTERIRAYSKSEVVEILHGLPYVRRKNREDRIICKERLGVKDRFTILLFGFIRNAKGYEHIIRAVKKIVEFEPSLKEKVKVMLVGMPILPEDQSYLNFLKEVVCNLGLRDNLLTIARYLNNSEVDTVFGATDAIVLSYNRRVGPSGVLSFALAHEIPSVTTCDEKYITHDANLPTLVVNLDSGEIAKAILKLITDRNEYERQVREIRKYKISNSNQSIASMQVKFYEKCISTKHARNQ